MTRENHTPIARTFAAGFAAGILLTGSGCALVGPADPSASTGSSAQADSSETDAVQAALDGRAEVRNWSQYTKSGREHLQFDRLNAAEQDLLAAFEIAQDFRISDARRHASIGNLEKLAADYRITGNSTAAARVLQVIADATGNLSEFDSPGLSVAMLDLGDLHLENGKPAAAAMAYERALELRIEKSGANSSTLIPIYQKLSNVEIKLRHFPRALEHATRGLTLAETHMGPNSTEMVASEIQVATAQQHAGNHREAESHFKRALKIQRAIEPASLDEAIALNGLAILFLETGRLAEALSNVDMSLSILEEIGRGEIDRAMVLDTKAQILAAEGRSESAARLFDEVMLAAAAANPQDQRVLYESYETFLREQNRNSEALEIRRKIEQLDAGPVLEEPEVHDDDGIEASKNAADSDAVLPDVSSPGPDSDSKAAWD